MKKFTLFTFLLLITVGSVFAQIPNGSFENWTNYPSGSYPTGWTTSDSVGMTALCGAAHNAVQETTEKCNLAFAIKLTTWTCFTQLIPAVATNGLVAASLSGVTVSGGTPDQIRNDSLTGCYEYAPASGANIAAITAVLYKRNGAKRDTIAIASFLPTAAGTMTNFSVPFVYMDTDPSHLPDSILVICASSLGLNTSAVVGSVLIVDHLALKGTFNNVQENVAIKEVKVYPMPASGNVLHIDVKFGHFVKSTYSLIDNLGRVVKMDNLKETQQIDIAQLANGVYTLTLNNESGEKLYSTRVTVSR